MELIICLLLILAAFAASRLREKRVAALALLVVVALLAEGFLCNIRFWQTRGDTPIAPTEMELGIGLSEQEENTYFVTSKTDQTITLYGIDAPVHTLHLNASIVDLPKKEQAVTFSLSATDEANAQPLSLASRTVVPSVTRSQYTTLHLYGDVGAITLRFSLPQGQRLLIESLALNTPIPMHFSLLRLCLMLVFMLLCAVFLFTPRLYRIRMHAGGGRQRIVTCALIVAQAAVMIASITANSVYLSPPWQHHKQYQQLAHSFSAGRLDLDLEVPPSLLAMENPYDSVDRQRILAENNEYAQWDTAYYDGKFYVYFGVVPAVLFYWPYYAITGQDLPNWFVVAVFALLLSVAIFGLLRELILRYFPRTPYALYLMLSLIMVNSSSVVWLLREPEIYTTPKMGALAFAMLGLWMWLAALRKPKLRTLKLLIGSTSMALVAGCRPQLVFLSVAVIFLFWTPVLRDRMLFSKATLRETLAFCLPYVVVAAALMWYNAARFGSIADFGANYNLTALDMTRRVTGIDHLGQAIFTNLFQPPVISALYPFVRATAYGSAYMGRTFTAAMYGGVLTTNALFPVLCLLGRVRQTLKEKGLWGFTLFLLAFGVALAILAAVIGGYQQCYTADFGLVLLLAAVVVTLALADRVTDTTLDALLGRAVFIALLLTLAFAVMLTLVDNFYGLSHNNTPLYYGLQTFLQVTL